METPLKRNPIIQIGSYIFTSRDYASGIPVDNHDCKTLTVYDWIFNIEGDIYHVYMEPIEDGPAKGYCKQIYIAGYSLTELNSMSNNISIEHYNGNNNKEEKEEDHPIR